MKIKITDQGRDKKNNMISQELTLMSELILFLTFTYHITQFITQINITFHIIYLFGSSYEPRFIPHHEWGKNEWRQNHKKSKKVIGSGNKEKKIRKKLCNTKSQHNTKKRKFVVATKKMCGFC